MAVISIDLASCRYRDIGIAVLEGEPAAARVKLVRPADRGLSGEPDPVVVAHFILELSSEFNACIALIDGPQGWRSGPGKNRSTRNRSAMPLERWSQKLTELCGVRWERTPTHDEIQAVAAGIGGLCLVHYGAEGCDIQGEEPRYESGTWREGFILSPRNVAAMAQGS
jgi:hypothetical protein